MQKKHFTKFNALNKTLRKLGVGRSLLIMTKGIYGGGGRKLVTSYTVIKD